jgi:hypothetical protein
VDGEYIKLCGVNRHVHEIKRGIRGVDREHKEKGKSFTYIGRSTMVYQVYRKKKKKHETDKGKKGQILKTPEKVKPNRVRSSKPDRLSIR